MNCGICDFCSSPDVAWRYPARTFAAYIVAGIVGESVGDWAACPACHALIESGQRSALADRSVRTLLEKQPDWKPAEPELRAHLLHLHAMFFESRVGKALPVA